MKCKYYVSFAFGYEGENIAKFGSGTYTTTINPNKDINKFLDNVEKLVAKDIFLDTKVHVTSIAILNFIKLK